MSDYSSTDMIEASKPDVRATDRWARDLIVKINRERADAGCVIYDLTEKRKTDAAEIARLRVALTEARERVAAVVQSHDAPGGCRGPVGYTAMGNLAEWLHTTEAE